MADRTFTLHALLDGLTGTGIEHADGTVDVDLVRNWHVEAPDVDQLVARLGSIAPGGIEIAYDEPAAVATGGESR